MLPEVRYVPASVERLLWGVAAGRCEFEGCNRTLYRHEVTGDADNYAEKAHIHAVSPKGARFDPSVDEFKNRFENLMLVCPQCHITIDRDAETYSPERLLAMKLKHEKRIHTLTNIGAELHSHMVYYSASIAGTQPPIDSGDARNALAFFGRYPTEDSPIDLSQKGSYIRDDDTDFYNINALHLQRAVKSRVLDVLASGSSISLFAIAPQPLLVRLGSLISDKYNVAVFQCHRRESDKWRWEIDCQPVEFRLSSRICDDEGPVALVFSLSSEIAEERITRVLGDRTSIYTVTINGPNRHFVKHPSIMDDFVKKVREAMEEIKRRHGNGADLHVFPVMPVSLAVRFGMDYMPKTDNPLIVYDNLANKGFVEALRIGRS